VVCAQAFGVEKMTDVFVARTKAHLGAYCEIHIIDEKIYQIFMADVWGGMEIGRLEITKQEAIALLKQHKLDQGMFD
jgi:hypothetical protein